MNDRKHSVLIAIAEFWLLNHYAPAYEEVGLRTGIASKSNVKGFVDCLTREGLLSNGGVTRSVQPTERGWEVSGVKRPCVVKGERCDYDT